MFKALLLQRLYDLSDRQIEECLYDRFSFRRFCGFGLDEALPDATTLLRFRQALGGKTQSLLDLVNEELRAQGVQMGQGAIVDATIIRSSAKTPQAGEVSNVDPEAGWTQKGGVYTHGYKAHVAVDEVHGFVQATVATGAEVHDSQVFGALLTGEETAVYGDKAYGSAANRQWLAQGGTKDCLLYKASKNKPLTPWQRWLNKLYGPIRQTIERTFAHWKGVLGLTRARYRGWAKNQVQFDLLAMAYNLRRSLKLIPSG
jgi:IS5 family transposase